MAVSDLGVHGQCREAREAGPSEDLLAMRDENAALRELCKRLVEYVSQDRCEGCVCKRRCDDGMIEECWQMTEIRGLARGLGFEVDHG